MQSLTPRVDTMLTLVMECSHLTDGFAPSWRWVFKHAHYLMSPSYKITDLNFINVITLWLLKQACFFSWTDQWQMPPWRWSQWHCTTVDGPPCKWSSCWSAREVVRFYSDLWSASVGRARALGGICVSTDHPWNHLHYHCSTKQKIKDKKSVRKRFLNLHNTCLGYYDENRTSSHPYAIRYAL